MDRIKGLIYGQCLGDAVGLLTQFKFKKDLGTVPEFPYKNVLRGFVPCDWTDDSDHMILTMQSLTDNDLKINQQDLAERLNNWLGTGFAELGDVTGLGVTGPMSMIIKHHDFIKDPEAAAKEIWANSGQKLSTNECLPRTAPMAALERFDVDEVAKLARLTHVDARCVASCILFGHLCWDLIHSDKFADDMLMDAVNKAKGYLEQEHEFSECIRIGYTEPIEALKLDEVGKIGNVYKCLGAALYSLHAIKYAQSNNALPSFKKVITKIMGECGDANANCAAAGAVLGAYLGYSRLPQDWLEALPHREWLSKQIDRFLARLEGKTNLAGPLEAIALTNQILES